MVFRSLERYHTYKPDRTYYEKVDSFNHEIDTIEDAFGNRIELRYKRFSDERLILFSHGNKSNISSLDERYRFMEAFQCSYLSYDYPGYGRSSGEPSEEGLYASHHAAINYALSLGYALENIILHGLSLGGAIALEGAISHPGIQSLILEATFVHSHAMAKKIFKNIPVYLFVPNRFQSLKRITHITCPVLIIHGTEDETTPYEHGRLLYEAAPEPKYLYALEGAGHTNLLEVGGERYREVYDAFIHTKEVPEKFLS